MTQLHVAKKAPGDIAPYFKNAAETPKVCLKDEWSKGGRFSQQKSREYEAKEIENSWHWMAWLYLA